MQASLAAKEAKGARKNESKVAVAASAAARKEAKNVRLAEATAAKAV